MADDDEPLEVAGREYLALVDGLAREMNLDAGVTAALRDHGRQLGAMVGNPGVLAPPPGLPAWAVAAIVDGVEDATGTRPTVSSLDDRETPDA